MMKVHFQSGVIDHENNNNSNNKSNTNSNSNNNSNSNGNCLRYGFDSKTSLDAFGDLLEERSQQLTTVRPPRDLDIWKRKPPDFTPRVYNPKPPKRNTREAIQPWKYVCASDEKMLERKDAAAADDDDEWKECPLLPQIFKDAVNGDGKDAGEDGSDEFVTSFKTAGLLDAKLLFVRNGMRKRSAYRMPKPHDFRGLPPIASLGLPEFSTKSERDPYNLKFNKENPANVLRWSQPQPMPCHDDDPGSSVSPMTPPPKWDRKLILPKTQWPNKYAAYTRHRRWDRSAYSAKMERIEQQLTEQWKHESVEGLHPAKSRV